jgi:hypothetical protein
MSGPTARVVWAVRATPAEVVAHLRAAARPLGIAVELGQDQALFGGASGGTQEAGGTLAGWLYTGNASGTPAGRMDVADVRLSPVAESQTLLELIRFGRPVPSRFEKQWSLHEVRFKAPLLWNSVLTATRLRLTAAGIPPVAAGHAR